MTQKKTEIPDIQKIQDFFFEAAGKGYAGRLLKKGSIPLFPGFRVYQYQREPDDGFWYVELYYPGMRSFGISVIGYKQQPLLGMTHHGLWRKNKLVQFLRRVLQATYNKKEFVGGRGFSFF